MGHNWCHITTYFIREGTEDEIHWCSRCGILRRRDADPEQQSDTSYTLLGSQDFPTRFGPSTGIEKDPGCISRVAGNVILPRKISLDDPYEVDLESSIEEALLSVDPALPIIGKIFALEDEYYKETQRFPTHVVVGTIEYEELVAELLFMKKNGGYELSLKIVFYPGEVEMKVVRSAVFELLRFYD